MATAVLNNQEEFIISKKYEIYNIVDGVEEEKPLLQV